MEKHLSIYAHFPSPARERERVSLLRSFYDNSAINGDIRIELQLDRIGNRDDLINGNRLGDLDYLIMLISVILFTLIDGTPILDRIQGIQKFLMRSRATPVPTCMAVMAV